MWIVICREHNEDPLYTTLVPHPSMFAWRLTMFVYFDRGAAGIERLTVNRYGSGDLHKEFPNYYQAAWEPEDIDSWQRLARIVRARNPKRIAVNESETFAFADGLSATNKTLLVRALGPEYAGRLVSAERLAVGLARAPLAGGTRVLPADRGPQSSDRGRGLLERGDQARGDDHRRSRVVGQRTDRGTEAGHVVSADVLHHPAGDGGAGQPGDPARRPAAVRHRRHLRGPQLGHPGERLRAARRRDRSAQGSQCRSRQGQSPAGHPACRR